MKHKVRKHFIIPISHEGFGVFLKKFSYWVILENKYKVEFRINSFF